jgi:hypothetical protein
MDTKSLIVQHLRQCREEIEGMTKEEILQWSLSNGQDLERKGTYDIELQKSRPIDFSTSIIARLNINTLVLLASSPPYLFSKYVLFPMNILETCAICLENKKFKKTFIELNCGHKFHKNCLETWFKTAVSCPLCKLDVSLLSFFDLDFRNLFNCDLSVSISFC